MNNDYDREDTALPHITLDEQLEIDEELLNYTLGMIDSSRKIPDGV